MFVYDRQMALRPPVILHADLDAFYASVEQLLDPSLRGLPIAVGGGVVLAASYEAKRFGVAGGMSGHVAKRLCPTLRFVGGHYREYHRLADEVMAVLGDFTPHVQRISIDEAFLDVTGSTHLFGTGGVIADTIRRRVRAEIGLPISVGVATTKHLAKVASQVAKPDGLVVVEPGTELTFLDPLPVELLWGVGPATHAKLAARGITTIGQLGEAEVGWLRSLLGNAVGSKMNGLAANRDERSVKPMGRGASVGAQSGFGRQQVSDELLRSVLGMLSDRVAGRLRAGGRGGRTVTVRIRFPRRGRPGHTITRSRTLAAPVAATLTLTGVAVALARSSIRDLGETEVSLLAVQVSNLVGLPAVQMELDVAGDDALRPGSPTGAARWMVDQSVDLVRTRFGRGAVGYAGAVLSSFTHVPDEFRELAERPDSHGA